MEVSGQLHDPAALPPEKEVLLSIDRGLGGPKKKILQKLIVKP
jgi:hypothetical protein